MLRVARCFSSTTRDFNARALQAAFPSIRKLVSTAAQSNDPDEVRHAKEACVEFIERYQQLLTSSPSAQDKSETEKTLRPLVNEVRGALVDLFAGRSFRL